jgi:hypothetical protein
LARCNVACNCCSPGDRQRSLDVAFGLQPAGLRQAPGNEIVPFPVGDPAGQALRQSVLRLQFQHFPHGPVGGLPFGIHQPPCPIQKRIDQHGSNYGVPGIQLIRLVERVERLFRRGFFAEFAGAIEALQGLASPFLVLAHQLLELQQLRLARKFGQRALDRLHGALVVPALQVLIRLLHPARLGILVRLLVAPFHQALNFEHQAGLLVVDRFEDLPLVQGFVELPAIFEKARLGDDRIHQVPLVAHQPHGPLEVRFAGIKLQRLFEDGCPFVQVGLGFHAPVGFRDHARQLLALALLHVELQCLKQRVVRVFCQVLPAGGGSGFEVVFGKVAARFLVRILQRVVLGVYLIIKILICAAAAGIGFRQVPVHGDQHFQPAEGGGDFALFPGSHGSLVQTRFFLAHAGHFLLPASHFRQQAQRLGVVGFEGYHVFQGIARLPERLVIQVLPAKRDPLRNLARSSLFLHLFLKRKRVQIFRIEFQRFLDFAQRQRIFGGFEKAPRAA